MKKLSVLFVASIVLLSCTSLKKQQTDPATVQNLSHLYEEQDFFKLKKSLEKQKEKLSDEYVLLFDAFVKNAFNQPAESNEDIDKLLSINDLSIKDSLLNKAYGVKLLNHINLFEYAEAAKTSEYIQQHYPRLNDSTSLANMKNELIIWKALSECPKQSIIHPNNFSTLLERDKIGLFNIGVNCSDTTLNFVFDTGANLSVLQKSVAQRLGIKPLDAEFYVTAATGNRVKSHIAIADSIKMGELIVRNVAFLIFNDEDLSFPQINYSIKGIIGYPVIRAMDEIRISKDHHLFVPKQAEKYSFSNFAVNGLMPIVACQYGNDTLRFHFDTGATSTSLFPLFYDKYRADIEANYKKQTFHAGSAGGSVNFEGYIINNTTLKIAESQAKLDSLRLHINVFDSENKNFHGNLGQDYIKQFDNMIISFKYSSLLFK